MPIANPDKNNKARVGNVTHPFTKRDIEAGKIIFGDETARDLDSTHPLRQTTGSHESASYNALQEFKNAQTNFGANTPASVVNPNINPNTASVPLPTSQVQTFTSGSYENPTSTTNPNANENTETVNPYSFMDELERVDKYVKDNPNKNKFGFWKRDAESFDARIEDAEGRGKTARAERLRRKKENFEDNQGRRAADPDSSTYTKPISNPNYDPNIDESKTNPKTITSQPLEKGKGGKFGNFIKSHL